MTRCSLLSPSSILAPARAPTQAWTSVASANSASEYQPSPNSRFSGSARAQTSCPGLNSFPLWPAEFCFLSYPWYPEDDISSLFTFLHIVALYPFPYGVIHGGGGGSMEGVSEKEWTQDSRAFIADSSCATVRLSFQNSIDSPLATGIIRQIILTLYQVGVLRNYKPYAGSTLPNVGPVPFP